jgi:hypothetical protein
MPGEETSTVKLHERVASLETKVTDIADMKKDIREIRDTLAQARGGWKTLMMVGGAAGAAGAIVGKFLPFFMSKP